MPCAPWSGTKPWAALRWTWSSTRPPRTGPPGATPRQSTCTSTTSVRTSGAGNAAFPNSAEMTAYVRSRRPAPRHFKMSYLVTAWTQRPEDEHRLLDQLLRCFLKYDALPDELVVGQLAETGLVVPVTVGLPPPEDRAFADVWSALGGELKPSLDVVVIAPVDTGIVFEAGPPASEGTHVDMADLTRRAPPMRAATSTPLHLHRSGGPGGRPADWGASTDDGEPQPRPRPRPGRRGRGADPPARRRPPCRGPAARRPVPGALPQRRGRRPPAR